MREQDDYKDLSDLFRIEDNALSAEPFTREVMRRGRRRMMARRLLVGSVGLAGAGIAALQLPRLLAGWVGVDATVTAAITTAQSDLTSAAAGNPVWLAVAAGLALCVFAVTALERG